MNLFLYSTIGTDWGLEIIPHWVRHYLELGISPLQFRLVLHCRKDQSHIEKARQLLSEFDIIPQFDWVGDFSSGENYKIRKRVWSECSMEAEDWFLIADSDEFHQYDYPINDFYSKLNAAEHNAVEAKMIDRVALDGRLTQIDPLTSLSEQYPYESNITETLLRMNTRKIIAHKRDTFSGQLYRANHGISPEFQSTTSLYQGNCTVAHYKWTAGVLDRLESRVRHYYKIGRTTDAQKNEQFINLVRSQGKLPLGSPKLANSMLSR